MTDNNPDTIASGIDSVLSKPGNGSEYTHFVRASVSEYSWENVVGSIIEEFRLTLTEELAAVA